MADEEQQSGSTHGDGDEGDDTPLAIVGVGVCAASLRSLAALFSSLTAEANAAYLIAVRQKEGLNVAAVMAALAENSTFPAKLAEDGERIAAHRVYVAAPDDLITIVDGHLRVRPAIEPIGHRGAFDSLLISLAEHAHERAVAVILAGLGSDGSAGVVATKKFGGLSIAEAAGHGDLSAVTADPAAVADLMLPVDRIAGEIARYIRNLQPILQEEEREEDGGGIEAQVTQVATILRNATGHDFHGYKRGTFVRRVQRRIQVMQIDGGIAAYVERLRADRDEVQHLFQDLLIGVTQFFRDPSEFDSLERELPRLFEKKEAGDQFRVWVLGCATGEEAYSIAILLREHLATLDHPPEVQIFATDLDARALSIARAGRYADTIANHIRPDRLERWFAREGDTYCVSKELREMCIFSPHNIVKDAPFSRIDILSCRNLLIYLSTDLQNRVIPIFHFSLRPDGILFLGSSENVTRHAKLFAPVDRKSRVFRRLETATRIIPDFPLTPRLRGGGPAANQPAPAPFDGRLPAAVSRQAEAIAERHAPAYVVVDTAGDVLHFSGRTGRYLEPTAGTASLSLPNLVHRDLRLDVRTALGRAIAETRRVEVPRLTVRQDDRAFAVNVVVEPLTAGDVTALVVLFQDLGAIADGAADTDRLTTDEHVQRLEAELRVTRDRLQATIEELESTNEELKSSNEEYQSINEELQSANEEMETSKEELQSVNEELQTVNGELAHRVQDLGRTNSDMKNLLESTQIATLFLDNDLRIRNFTPAATDIFHLLETDVGRPLDHVVSRVSYPELVEDVRRVLKTLVPTERQVSDEAADRHFAARVLPYRSIDNYISGAVVTFTDLTAVHQAQAALRDSEALRLVALAAGRMGTWRWDLDAALIWGDAQFWSLWGYPPSDEPRPLSDFNARMSPESTADIAAVVTRAIEVGAQFDGPLEIVAGPTAGRWLRWQGRAEGDNISVLHGVTFDTTEQRHADALMHESTERQAFLLELSDALRPLADPHDIELAAAQVLGRRLGASRVAYAENVGDEFFEVARNYVDGVPEAVGRYRYADYGTDWSDLQAGNNRVQPDVARDERLSDAERGELAANGVGASLNVPLVKGGRLVAFLGVNYRAAHDFTPAEIALVIDVAERTWAAVERARAEAALHESEERFQQFGAHSGDVLWIIDVATQRLEYLSPAFETVWGESRDRVIADLARWDELVHPDDRAEAAKALPTLLGGASPHQVQYRIVRPADGEVRWIVDTGFAIRDAQGHIHRVAGVAQDFTARVLAERAMTESERRQRTLLEGIPQLVWRAIGSGEWTWASPQWTEFTGQAEPDSHGWGWLAALHPDDREKARAAWGEAVETGALDVEYRVHHAADGSYRWFHTRASPVRDEGGGIVEWLGTSTDIDELRRLQDLQKTLLAELQHRVRNVLAVIRSLVRRSSQGHDSLDDYVRHLDGRLSALARTQVLLTRAVDAKVDLEDLIRDELLAQAADESRITLSGSEIGLGPKPAEVVSLAIHELATNAVKYGALSRKAATLAIAWRTEDRGGTPWLSLTWSESGVAVSESTPRPQGFGTELIIRRVPYELKGQGSLKMRPGGIECTLEFPLSDRASILQTDARAVSTEEGQDGS